jgi:hypothetical protein
MMSPINNVSASINLPDAQDSGLAAIARGSQMLSNEAQQIANPDSPNVTSSLVDLNQSRVLTESGANVLRAENKMLGTLFDMFA